MGRANISLTTYGSQNKKFHNRKREEKTKTNGQQPKTKTIKTPNRYKHQNKKHQAKHKKENQGQKKLTIGSICRNKIQIISIAIYQCSIAFSFK